MKLIKISDANCGVAFVAAEDDFVFGLIDGCGRSNPDEDAVAPSTSPVCV